MYGEAKEFGKSASKKAALMIGLSINMEMKSIGSLNIALIEAISA